MPFVTATTTTPTLMETTERNQDTAIGEMSLHIISTRAIMALTWVSVYPPEVVTGARIGTQSRSMLMTFAFLERLSMIARSNRRLKATDFIVPCKMAVDSDVSVSNA